ncbi:AMP-binding protein [Cohnella fermenti]|uniref:Long-chain fatty acid--CoA ligase n=1 Tax=Cohnella fermenti TaxID=2565925 RepID=A0A4S4BSI4_9BACL|nr:AMP-binding protein [Cohnella fermenti]THF77999.1 long-chain fatty acid--CoA ligase [Cohnella fermenti]
MELGDKTAEIWESKAPEGIRLQEWWSRFPPLREPSEDPPDGNAANLLVRAARERPSDPAYSFEGRTCSYARLLGRCFRFANGLRSIGVKRGERVAIYLPTVPAAIEAYYGVLLAGGVAVPIHELCEPEEAARRTAETGAAAVIASRSLLRDRGLFHEAVGTIKIILIEERRGRWKGQEAVEAAWSGLRRRVGKGDVGLVHGIALLGAAQAHGEAEEAAAGDLAVIQYSSGTTGPAKGALFTHGSIAAGAVRQAYWIGGVNAEEEPIGRATPLLHPEGLASLNAAAARTGCVALASGSSDATKERTSGRYSLAEAASLALALPPRGKRRDGALGFPLPGVEARVVGTGSLDEMPPGEVGELIVRGAQIAFGYWKKGTPPERQDWIRTGDLVSRDEAGCFYWGDRAFHRFATERGMITPGEMEKIIAAHPAVAKACVGRTQAPGGEAIVRIILRRGRIASAVQLERWCRDRLGAGGTPIRCEFVDALPLTPWGEPLKRELQTTATATAEAEVADQEAVYATV